MRTWPERVGGPKWKNALSDEAPTADRAYECHLALPRLIQEQSSILDHILTWDSRLEDRAEKVGNSKIRK